MFQSFPPLLRRLDEHPQVTLDLFLPNVFLQALRPKVKFIPQVIFRQLWLNPPIYEGRGSRPLG
jgi:hypothetical protein